MEKIITPCGDDCSMCPKYTAQSPEELQKVAELWHRYSLAQKEVLAKYKKELAEIEQQLSKKGKTTDEKKVLKSKQKEIELHIETEVKALVKSRFNYDVLLAEAEKAGISTTGAVIENKLEPLEVEYTTYRKANKLWDNVFSKITYQITDNYEISRVVLAERNVVVGEPEVFYGE